MRLVMDALRRQASRVQILVHTNSPTWLYPPSVSTVPVHVDVGVLQRDSLTIMADETIIRAAAFERERPALADAEANTLQPFRPLAIVGDIPPLAFEVAARLGVPGIAVGNFSWDWIYAGLGSSRPEIHELVASIVASERLATLLLRLPFHDVMGAFPRIEDVPLIAHVSCKDRQATRRSLGLPVDRPLVLISYGGFAFEQLNTAIFATVPDVQFVATAPLCGTPPPNLITLPMQTDRYHDLLAACDAVMMKPGYGTVADCVANRVPMIYTSRPGFREEEILIGAMERVGRAVPLPADALYAGQLRPAIERALADRSPWAPLRVDGADVVARRILEIAGRADLMDLPCGAPD